MDPKTEEEVRRLVEAGRKIDAIKVVIEATGVGLAEAKAVVDALDRGETPPAAARGGALPPEIVAEIRRLAGEGRKIDAIRTLREATGCGLAEAKDAIEAVEQGLPLAIRAPGRPLDPEFAAEVKRLAREGQLLEAVRLYRERTGLGLKEAREEVEALAGLSVPGTRSGCLGVLLAFFV